MSEAKIEGGVEWFVDGNGEDACQCARCQTAERPDEQLYGVTRGEREDEEAHAWMSSAGRAGCALESCAG